MPFPAVVDLDDIAAGSGGFQIAGAGGSVSDAGDVNGDGIDDLIVGAAMAARRRGLCGIRTDRRLRQPCRPR